MKKFLYFSAIILVSVLLIQCTKEGTQGPAGINGTSGLDGNANVTTYIITDSIKLLWGGNYIQLHYDSTFNIPDSIQNEGVVLMYMRFSSSMTFWYPVPGVGLNGTCLIRFALGDERIAINIMNPDGSVWSGGTPPEVDAIRIILIPASTIILLGAPGRSVDVSNLDEVMDYYGLE